MKKDEYKFSEKGKKTTKDFDLSFLVTREERIEIKKNEIFNLLYLLYHSSK